MTDRSKFEQMLEHLVNEDTEQARELFHQIVVEKSREIYEEILAEDFDLSEEDEEKEDEEEKEVDEAKDEDEDTEMEEDFAFGEGDDEDDEGPVGGDPTDDMMKDIEASSEEGEEEPPMGDEGEIEDRVLDLEDAIDDLRAQFEKEFGGGDMDSDMNMDKDMGMGDEDDMKMGEDDMFMREYVEKVGGADYTKYGKMGDNGANTKSIVAGKNDMGGTTANIVKGGESTTGGTKGGLANPSTKEENFGNVNVPGGNAGKTAFKKKEPGHGAEKKGAGESADNKRSIIGGKK
jgi:hypothetical protein